MYYNSNQNSNDYYSAYKEEMGNSSKSQDSKVHNQILKPGLMILSLSLLAVGVLYFFNYFSSELKENTSILTTSKMVEADTTQVKKDESPAIKLSEDTLPQSIQLQESGAQAIAQIKQNATITHVAQNSSNDTSIKETISSVTGSSNINPKDIELIVKIIMSQMNQAPQEEIATDTTGSLEEQLVAAEEQVMEKQTLKESNHYNKVIVSSNEPVTDTSNELMQLQNSLNDALEENTEKSEGSDYSKAISEEVVVRSNEMRTIVVKEGDTLSKIAKEAYGNYDDYVKIFNANPEVVKNPDEIYAGQRLRIPS